MLLNLLQNMVRKALFLSLIAVLLFSGLSSAEITAPKGFNPILPTLFDLSQISHDENEVGLMISNRGIIGQNLTTGNGSGRWPSSPANNYIFGSGLWIGGIADVDGDMDMDTVTVMGYEASAGATEFAEGRVGQDPSDPLARVFSSQDSTDLEEWPDEFRTPGGVPFLISDQDFVTIYNDISGVQIGRHQLGIQVNQTSMAFSGKVAGTSVHAIYFVWEVVNMSDSLPDGPYTIEDLYVGFCGDMDMGPGSTDDKTSFIPNYVDAGDTTLLNTAVVWDQDFTEVGFTKDVGIVGFSFDESILTGAEVNYTFMSNPSQGQPRPDPDPPGDTEQYYILTCQNDQCGEWDIGTDVRFVLSIGPVDLDPGENQFYRGVLFFADPFADPSALVMSGDPIRVDPYQEGMANIIQVALETKQAIRSLTIPLTFSIFRTSMHEDTSDTTGPYTIYTGIVDSIGVKEVTLHYSVDGGSVYNPVPMSEDAILNYSGDIPGQPFGTTVMYYVEALDSADVSLTDPADAPNTVYSFLVEELTGIGGGSPGQGLPMAFSLGQNYPNPFNPSTTLTFEIPGIENKRSHVSLKIYDLRGRCVRTLVDAELTAGSHSVQWDGRNDSGEQVSSGIYLYSLQAGDETFARKMTLVK